MLNVTLVRSTIGHPKDQRATVRSLGLRRMHDRVDLPDTPVVRGMLHKVRHLIHMEESEGAHEAP
ncbi:MAG: 50S ribosomal protein L30 [Chloroflexi bacterium]|nr:50S ribosomal protein L30 [Chloroflexota bacterium]